MLTARNLLLLSLFAAAGLPAAAPAVVAPLAIPAAVRARVLQSGLIDLPTGWRHANWTGLRRQGSCVHASICSLLEWQGQHALAARWSATHGDGETPAGLAGKFEAAKIPYAETRGADVGFLDWAVRTRRGAAVVVQSGAHMVSLVGLDAQSARLLDSNAPETLQTISREIFLSDWRASGGWAITPLAGAPTPPDPWLFSPAPATQKDPQ